MGFESRAISARVTKQIVTIFSKACDKDIYFDCDVKKRLINSNKQIICTVQKYEQN